MSSWLKKVFFILTVILVLTGRGGEFGFCHENGAAFASKSVKCVEDEGNFKDSPQQHSHNPKPGFCANGCCETISVESDARALDHISLPVPLLPLVQILELPNPFLSDISGGDFLTIDETAPPGGFGSTRSPVRLL